MAVNESIVPKLQVIEGGNQTPPPWMTFPREIAGPSPFKKGGEALYRLDHSAIQKSLGHNRINPALDVWSHVLGKIPPLPNASKLEQEIGNRTILTVRDAHACFQGVKRPVGADQRGFYHVAFVLKPEFMLVFEPSMTCLAKVVDVPPDIVVVVYAKLDHERDGPYDSASGTKRVVRGIITNIDYVEVDGEDCSLPIDHRTRYRRRNW